MTMPNPELQVDVVEKAVSDSSGTVEFFMEADFGETAILVQRHSRTQARAISVSMVTLDAEMASRGIDRIDMLKIDAEGHDLRVLLGGAWAT